MLKILTESQPRTRIHSASTALIDLPLRRTQQFARLGATVQSTIIVRIRTECGLEGIGEAITPCGPWWSGDSVEAMKATLDTYLIPALVGEDPCNVDAIMGRLRRVVRDNAFAKTGIEMALMDLVGKLLGAPVHVLLGGRARTSLPVAWPLASGDEKTDLAEIEDMLETRRAGAFKVKMGALPLDEDLKRIAVLARAVEGRAGLRVDPNEAWSEAEANRALPHLEDVGVEMVEQPVMRWNLDAMARLSARSRTIMMIDEGVQSNHDMIEVVKRAAADMVSLKLMKTGGLRPTKKMADIASAAGLSVYMGTFLETSLGTAANMHLAATLPSLPLGGETIGPLLLAEDITTIPATYGDHALWLPEGPGLGVELDEDRIRHFTRK